MTGHDGITPTLLFPIRKPYMTVGGAATGPDSFKIDYGETIEYVAMEYQQWAFPNSTFTSTDNAIPVRYYNFEHQSHVEPMIGVVAVGYRCLNCRKVFFAADEAGLVHECMEAAEEVA